MKRTTRKLSGPSLDRFLQRFFRRQPGLEPAQADHLAKVSARTITSASVRTVALNALRAPRPASPPSSTRHISDPVSSGDTRPADILPANAASAAPPPDAHVTPVASHARHGTPSGPPAAGREDTAQAPPPASDRFDPYVFGLVPVYQRQGPEGLLARLAEIPHAAQLRTMAKAQQIVLPAELRGGDVNVDDIRAGIVAAVGKRIADRRAAAG